MKMFFKKKPQEKEDIVDVLDGHLRDIINKLVDKPEEVIINRTTSSQKAIFEIHAGSQTGFLIGKAGKTISAIRQIMFSFYNKFRRQNEVQFKEVVIEIIDPEKDGDNNNGE